MSGLSYCELSLVVLGSLGRSGRGGVGGDREADGAKVVRRA